MAVTIMQIAERLDLSHSTVSRVLNNKPNTFIAEETKRRVLATARELGYRPNLAARSLRDARSNMVGIFSSSYIPMSGGVVDIAGALAETLHPRDLNLFLALVAEDGTESKAMPVWRFDGAIILQRPPAATVEHLLTVDRPFVAINEAVEQGISVLADDHGGVRLAMDHLWELGHRRIAYASSSAWHFAHYSVQERHEAYISYYAERGCAPVSGHDFVPTDADIRNPDVRVPWLRRLVLEEGATAIVAYDHMVMVEVLMAAHQLMLRIPKDISVICFNDELLTAKVNPPMTVVTLQSREMGRYAGEMLLARMDAGEGALPSPDSTLPRLVRVPERLVVRESTGPAAR